MELVIFLILSALGLVSFVVGVKLHLPLVAYLGLGLILIASTQNKIDGIYYKSGYTEFEGTGNNTILYNYTNFNTTSIGASDWYIDATSGLLFMFALLSLGWYAFRDPIGEVIPKKR